MKRTTASPKYAIAVVDRHSKFIGYLMNYIHKGDCTICYITPNTQLCKRYETASRARCGMKKYQDFDAVYKYNMDGEFECEYLPLEDDIAPFDHIHDVKGCRMKIEEIL